MYQMHLTTCRLCGCVNEIRNLSGRQASKTMQSWSTERPRFETSQADRHRKRLVELVARRQNSKPLRPTGIENYHIEREQAQIIRNLSVRQASKTPATNPASRPRFETSQADRHRKPYAFNQTLPFNSKPLRPTDIEN